MALLLATVTITGTQSVHAHGHHGHHGGHVSVMPATGNAAALAAHSTAFLYGFGLGKNAGMRGYYDVMNECANRPYVSTNLTSAIKHFTSVLFNNKKR